MRKQTKLVAVLSAAALLAIGASMTSFAARGWVEENGSWYYYNNDDDYAVEAWKKSGNNWFWLGEDGAMVTDALIEDGDYYYYVNANGAMVTNSWVAVEPDDDDIDDDTPDHYWYYFGSNGKAYKAGNSGLSIKTINGKKYGFDENSRMVYGFVQKDGTKNQEENPFMEADYYFGSSDDGAMHTDWLQYMDGSDESSMVNGENRDYDEMDEMWFYFKPSNGQMVKADSKELKTQTIRGNKYGFDENGVMVYDWNNTESTESTPSIKYFSDQTDGHLKKKTWIYAVPTEAMDKQTGATDNNDDTSRWFYADATGTLAKNEIKKVNGKKYLFNEVGVMQSGLQWVDTSNGLGEVEILDAITDESSDIKNPRYDNKNKTPIEVTEDINLYYFSGDEEGDGSMKTGKNIKIELDDDTYTFAFKKNGQAYDFDKDGLVDKKIYVNGLLINADSDTRYTTFNNLGDAAEKSSLPKAALEYLDDTDYYQYLVGTTGTVVKEGKYVKDGDDNWWAVTEEGAFNFGSEDDTSKDVAKCVANGDGELIKEDSEGDISCKD